MLLLSLALIWIWSASASGQSQSESPRPSERPAAVDISAAPRDSLEAWLLDLVWLTERQAADLRVQRSLADARVDSVRRRLELAERRLAWEQEQEPWLVRWLLPAALTAGVVIGVSVGR
jgi:hypothetical protein